MTHRLNLLYNFAEETKAIGWKIRAVERAQEKKNIPNTVMHLRCITRMETFLQYSKCDEFLRDYDKFSIANIGRFVFQLPIRDFPNKF